MNESRLSALLEQAVADLPTRERGNEALRRAGAVRRGRTITGVAAVATAAVLALTLPQVLAGTDRSPSPAPDVTPTPEPSLVPAPPLEASDFPRWDPFTLPDLPLGESVLPEVLDPPDGAPSVLDRPLSAAVVAWPQEARDLMLLGIDGSWRSVPNTADAADGYLSEVLAPVLTLDGTRVGMSTREGIVIVDVTTGTRKVHPWPPEIPQPTDTLPELDWLPGDRQIHVNYWNKQWIVDAADGSDRPAPWSPVGEGWGYPIAVDPEGVVVQHRFDHNDLVAWDDDRIVNDVPAAWWGERYVARHGLVAFTGNIASGAQGGPAVVNRDTAEVVAWLRLPDRNGEYSDNGHLTVQGFLNKTTLLVKVAPMRFGEMQPGQETWYLATWNYETGAIERLTSGDTRMRTIAVATDVVR